MATPIESGLAYLCATFRAELDSFQVRAYKRALAGIAGDVVMTACERLIDEAAAGRKFYPLPTAPQWKEACAKVLDQKRRDAFRLSTASCEHSRFMEEYQKDDGTWWTRRCACYQQGMKAMEAAGQPLALPSYQEPDENGD